MDSNNQNQEDNKSFKPAANPFNKTGSKDVEIGGVGATLVGKGVDSKPSQSAKAKVPEEILFQWEAPEFVYTHKPIGWYIGIFAFFSGLIAIAVWQQQWISIGLLAIMAVAISVWANRKPNTLLYKITNYGLEVGEKKYLYDNFRAFYEYNDYNQPTIDLVPTKRFGTLVSLPLATPDAGEVKETIAHMIPEIEHHEDIVDKLFRRLRF